MKRVRQAWFRGQSWGAQDRSEIQSDQKDQEHQLKEHRVHRRPEALASILEDPRCQAHTRHALELVRVLQKLRGEHPIVAHLCNPGRVPKQRSSLAAASPWGSAMCSNTADEMTAQMPSHGPHNCAMTALIDPSSQHLQNRSLPAATSIGRPVHTTTDTMANASARGSVRSGDSISPEWGAVHVCRAVVCARERWHGHGTELRVPAMVEAESKPVVDQ